MNTFDICHQHGRQDVAQMLSTASATLPSPLEMAERFEVAADLKGLLSGHFEAGQVEGFVTAWLTGGSIGLASVIIDFMAGGTDYRH